MLILVEPSSSLVMSQFKELIVAMPNAYYILPRAGTDFFFFLCAITRYSIFMFIFMLIFVEPSSDGNWFKFCYEPIYGINICYAKWLLYVTMCHYKVQH